MRTEGREAIIARVNAQQAALPEGAIACDCDGTLWSGDIGEDFFRALVDRGRFEPVAVQRMLLEAGEHGIAVDGDGAAIASRLYREYLQQRFPEERICELMAWGCAGWSQAEVETLARDVVAQGALPQRLHTEVVRLLEWARAARVEVFLVSASPRVVVELGARVVGVAPSNVIAATPTYEGTTMRAEVERPIPYGPGKVVRLRERIGSRPLYAAFGDNVFDIPMLREALVPVAVRPKTRLSSRAADVPGLVAMAEEGN